MKMGNEDSSGVKKKFNLLVISGCSGVGKGTLINYLLKKYPQLIQLSVSLTTRKPRQGQQNGRQYHFVTVQQFKNEIEKDVFAQYCQVHGNFYGTHQGKLDQVLNKGKICVLDIDLQGGQKIYKKFPNSVFLFIDPPSFEILEQRLKNRNSQTAEVIAKRLKNAKGELQVVKQLEYYHHLVNEKLDETEKNLIQFINKKYGLNLTA